MNIQKLSEDKKNGRVCFLIKGINPGFANALRRSIMDSVPTMAIDEVEFKKNMSVLYDEMIAHRLGLVPLKTDLKSYTISTQCKCGGVGCSRCTLKLTLKSSAVGELNAFSIKSKDPAVKPVYDIPIVKLLKEQEIELEATAKLGQGKEHVKFSPGLAYYRYLPIFSIDSGKCTNAEEVAKACSVNVFDVKNEKLVINKNNEYNCHLCGACADIAANGSVKLNETDSDYLFFIEPWGQLSVKEMLTTALEMFSKEIENFESVFKSAKKE